MIRLIDRTVTIAGRPVVIPVHRQKHFLEALPMVGGFGFDLLTLGRIDQLWSLLQQGIFLILIFALLFLETREEEKRRRFGPIWKYHGFLLQFMFGGLLSAYSIFYFKSASGILVALFAVFLFVLMVVNESKRFHSLNFPVKYILASLCLTSFLVYLFPIIFRWMNWFTFLLSVAASLFSYLWLVDHFHHQQTWMSQPKRSRAIWGALVPILFAGLYFVKVIPPVPLSCKHLGIYHDVARVGDQYELKYLRPFWKFWQHGDQTYWYRPGDKVWVFTSVFAPSDLAHEIKIHWEKRGARGWETTDRIPMAIKGGRDDGYRGVAYKQSISEGQWRVKVETEEGRELRRLRFEVKMDSGNDGRIYKVKYK